MKLNYLSLLVFINACSAVVQASVFERSVGMDGNAQPEYQQHSMDAKCSLSVYPTAGREMYLDFTTHFTQIHEAQLFHENFVAFGKNLVFRIDYLADRSFADMIVQDSDQGTFIRSGGSINREAIRFQATTHGLLHNIRSISGWCAFYPKH